MTMNLLGTLLTFSLSFVVLGAPLLAIHRLHPIVQTVRIKRREAVVRNRLETLLSQALSDIDSTRHSPSVRIQGASSITNIDGTPNPLSLTAPRLRPKLGSHLLTTLRVVPSPLRVVHIGSSATNPKVMACALGPIPTLMQMKRGYLGVGPTLAAYIAANPSRHPGRKECFDLSTNSLPTLTLPPTRDREELLSIRLLTPIEHEHTVYLSAQHELRFVSQVDGEILENQPLISEVDSLSFRSTTASFGNVTMLTAEAKVVGGSHAFTVTRIAATTAGSSDELLFNPL